MEFYVDIPYATRSEYLEPLYQAHCRLGSSEIVSLFVNNNPYCLRSAMCFQCDTDRAKAIKDMLIRSGLQPKSDKGMREFHREMGYRQWDAVVFGNCDSGTFRSMFQNAFLFSEEQSLREKGYKQQSFFKPKVFVSYCHDMWDSVVSDIIAGLEKNNINFWLDRKNLVSGQWLLTELLSQIDESDICVTLLSRSFETSKYGKQKLQLILDRSAGKKEWMFVKLDDIDPDKVLLGLDARYYNNYADNPDINLIIQEICSRVAKLQNQKMYE